MRFAILHLIWHVKKKNTYMKKKTQKKKTPQKKNLENQVMLAFQQHLGIIRSREGEISLVVEVSLI